MSIGSRGGGGGGPSSSVSAAYAVRTGLLFFLLWLILLLQITSQFQSVAAWKFRFGRGNQSRGSREGGGAGAGASLSSVPSSNNQGDKGQPSTRTAKASSSQVPLPPGADVPPAAAAADSESTSNSKRYLFGWGSVASSVAETAEETMEEAAQLLSQVVERFNLRRIQPPPVLTNAFHTAYAKLHAILAYKPPVGFVATFVVTRLLLSGRILGIKPQGDETSTEDKLFGINKAEQKQEYTGRSLILDGDDVSYSSYGGIERIRQRLCLAAVNGLLQQQQQQHDELVRQQQQGTNQESLSPSPSPQLLLTDSQHQLVQAAAHALSVSSQPTGSRLRLVHEMVESVAQLEELLPSDNQKKPLFATKPSNLFDDDCAIITSPQVVDQLLAVSAMTAQVRATDALLRLGRDRLLQTTYRLARTVEHWERREKQTRHWKRIVQRLLRNSIEGDRLQLSLAQAAYRAEVNRLGEVTAVLMERPGGSEWLPESALMDALKATEERAGRRRTQMPDSGSTTSGGGGSSSAGRKRLFFGRGDNDKTASSEQQEQPQTTAAKARQWMHRWTTPLFSKYSFRWKADRKGILSIRRFDAADGYIDTKSAVQALFANSNVGDDWMDRARDWTQEARRVVCQAVEGCIQGSTSDSMSEPCSEADFKILDGQWCSRMAATNRGTPSRPNSAVLEEQWRSVVNYVDSTPSWRRIGEGQKVRLRDAFRFIDFYKHWDFLGIPSSMLMIYGADVAHERFVKPYWATVRNEFFKASKKTGEIMQARVLEPLKGIYDDIMNKSPSMMSALGLEIEEMSLDHMLRDLGCGDGTRAARPEALKKAMEQYEQDISGGLVRNVIGGRLVRLMLLQIQQLKVGLLSALDTIDVLVESNKIYFRILAAIPAAVVATYGTRYMTRFFYNLRAKDIRPVTVVHGEMSHYLTKIENLLLLSDQADLSEGGDGTGGGLPRNAQKVDESSSTPRGCWATPLKPSELGELILNMHRYLILLDFGSPPFPSSSCDQIHNSLQQFLGTGGTLKRLQPDRQLLWLSRIQQKHKELVKNI